MSTRVLKWMAIVLPFGFMAAVIYMRVTFFTPEEAAAGNVVALVLVGLGATLFSVFLFDNIERREQEIRRQSLQLAALHEAALALTTELDLQAVLQKVVDQSRKLLTAKYGALAVREPGGTRIEHFFTSGITDEERAALGSPPEGRGLLKMPGPDSPPLLVDGIRAHPDSIGFPAGHPEMHTLVAVPIRSKGEVFGNIYLADKLLAPELNEEAYTSFDVADRELLEKFATQAAIAIENAQLYRQTRELAVLKERERFGMDLHDGIMQAVYATGLSLQEAQRSLDANPEEARARIEKSIEELSEVQRDIRNYILGLRPDRFGHQDLVAGVSEMARELRANTLLNVNVDAPRREDFAGLSSAQVAELLHVTQEALTNVRRHANARNVHIQLGKEDDRIFLLIEDDGTGFDPEAVAEGAGNGLRNMRERASMMEAEITLDAQAGQGTRIRVSLPVKDETPAA